MTGDLQNDWQRARVPWLAGMRARLAEALRQERLPHALLLIGQEGCGQAELAAWMAGLLLCNHAADGPCGNCADCALMLAGTHPDFHRVGIEAEATAIRVEQIRELAEVLGTRSYRGRRKVALIEPADDMNINSFNALLKTLEEPPDQTVLLLAATRADRLPATIRSRCSRQQLPLPVTGVALEWLSQQLPRDDWQRLLALAQGAPFLALDYAVAGLAELDADMAAVVTAGWKTPLDVVGMADAWRADRPELRLRWLELWLAGRLREVGLSSDGVNNNRRSGLPAALDPTMMAPGYRLLDRLREARRRVGGSLNLQLLIEDLLVDLAEWMRRGAWRARSNPSRN